MTYKPSRSSIAVQVARAVIAAQPYNDPALTFWRIQCDTRAAMGDAVHRAALDAGRSRQDAGEIGRRYLRTLNL